MMRKVICTTITGMLLAVTPAFVTALHAQTEEESIRVMSYNIHRGGVVMLKQPLSQTAKAIRLAKAEPLPQRKLEQRYRDHYQGQSKEGAEFWKWELSSAQVATLRNIVKDNKQMESICTYRAKLSSETFALMN